MTITRQGDPVADADLDRREIRDLIMNTKIDGGEHPDYFCVQPGVWMSYEKYQELLDQLKYVSNFMSNPNFNWEGLDRLIGELKLHGRREVED